MDFSTAATLLRERFNHYLAYIEAHPEFAQHKPMFILALGVGTGSSIIKRSAYGSDIDVPLYTGYMRPSAEAMVKGVDKGSGFQLEPFSPDRYKHKYISFVLAFDTAFLKHYYQYEFFNNFLQATPELISAGYYKSSYIPRPNDPIHSLPVLHEPTGVSPSKLMFGDRILRHVLQDSYGPSMKSVNPFNPDNKPNFYNIFCVAEYLPTPHLNSEQKKYKALRTANSPRTFDGILEGCDIEESYPLLQIRDILSKIIEMGGILGVQNDAWWMMRGGGLFFPENYYFENMCEIPKLLSEYPPNQVYRFEMEGPENREVLKATPFFSSIPEVAKMKKPYSHTSTWTTKGYKITNPNVPGNINISHQIQTRLPPEPSWSKGHWEGERWVPNARRGGALKRRFTKRRSRKQSRKQSRKHYN